MSRALVHCPKCRRKLGWTKPANPGRLPLVRLKPGVEALAPDDGSGAVRIRCPCGHELPWRGDVALRPTFAIIAVT